MTYVRGLRSRDESKIYNKVQIDYACIDQVAVDTNYRVSFQGYDIKMKCGDAAYSGAAYL